MILSLFWKTGLGTPPRTPRATPLARHAIALVGLSLTWCSVVACTPTSTTPANLSDGMTCGQRLVGGSWRFSGFAPDAPMDAQRGQAVTALQQSIRLTFDGQSARTTGTGVAAANPYQIGTDDKVNCVVIAADPSGIRSESQIHFVDPYHIEVTDQQSQNPGKALMERVPVGQ